MKTLNDIYTAITNKFYKKSKLKIAEGSTLDYLSLSVSEAIEDAHIEIDNNKNPHIFTNLKGSDIDSMGILVGSQREENEDDSSYLYRMINWNTSNQASNSTAIETALMNLKYSSNAKHVPFTYGVGTATVYIIPKTIDDVTKELAIKEVQNRLKNVVSKGSYIDYKIPKIMPITLIAYADISIDIDNVKSNIEEKIKSYINNIAPGDYLEIGELNKIGVNEPNVNYFSINQVYIDNKEKQEIKYLQKLEEKFLVAEIIWMQVVS